MFYTLNSFPIGSLCEVVLLSLALADKINSERRERYLAQRHALRAQEELLHAESQRAEQLLAVASQISDKLNSPLLVALNVTSALEKGFADDELARKRLPHLKTALAQIGDISTELAHLREVGNVEATQSLNHPDVTVFK